MCKAEIFFKCENFQKAGAFKIRGATNAVFALGEASWRGIKAYVVMPENAPRVKRDAVANYGAEITFCKPTLKAREEGLSKVLDLTGATFIHPYNDHRVISGQGTAAPFPQFHQRPVLSLQSPKGPMMHIVLFKLADLSLQIIPIPLPTDSAHPLATLHFPL
jgi:threonine dehydratase